MGNVRGPTDDLKMSVTTSFAMDIIHADYLLWNLILGLVNLYKVIMISMHEKPISLHPTLTALWENMFGPEHYNLEKLDFYMLTQERAQIRSLATGEDYFKEQDVVHKLSVLVEGKMVLSKTDD